MNGTRQYALRSALTLALVTVLPGAAGGQGLGRADSLAAAGDTVGALAMLEAAAEAGSAEAHYRAGRLLFAQYLADSAPAGNVRTRAEQHFRRATDLEPDSGHYWLGLAEVQRTRSLVTERMQVGGLVERALEAARAHGSGALADIHYRAAQLAWDDFEEQGRRYQFIGEARAVNQETLLDEWRSVEWFFDSQVRPDPGEPGADDLRNAEQHARAALGADPRHVQAAGLLTVVMAEGGRWEEAQETARRLVRAAPDSGRAWALLGLALARLDRWADAQAVYDTALTRMTSRQRGPYDNLALLLKTVDSARFESMSAAEREQLRRLYWTVAQPLFLNEVNQPRIEFMARLTYVMHRWSDPLRDLPGYASDRGQVYVRYGPPDIEANFGRGAVAGADAVSMLENERTAIVWVYRRSQARFMFSMTPGFARTRFGGDFESYYRQARNIFPARWDNVPAVADLDTMLVQFAQFRGADTEAPTQLGVYSFMPVGRMARGVSTDELSLTTAAIVKDGALRDVTTARRTETIRGGDPEQVEFRTYRLPLAPGDYLMRVEAWIAEAERGARSTSLLGIRRYGPDSLMMSDIVMADAVAPQDSAYVRWTDFFVQPSAGKFRPDEPVSLLWEVYNLTPDSTGTARYTVDLRFTVREIERRGFAARILGGIGDAIGLSAQGDDRVALQYDRSIAVQPDGAVVDYVSVDLENAPEATYTVTLTVTDRVSGRVVAGRRQFWVTETGLVR